MGERDPCPMDPGHATDDPYGGPCSACWRLTVDPELLEQLVLETWRPRVDVVTIDTHGLT